MNNNVKNNEMVGAERSVGSNANYARPRGEQLYSRVCEALWFACLKSLMNMELTFYIILLWLFILFWTLLFLKNG